ncbi:hypothetical protein KVF89_06865 [Nocardioides carbamazepini]|uniref:hypothetical protein n=1 Tax=Nocardioides carbamazepini TaxID=2854259 RepID=UPI002149A7DA|nr:hypothetical protein [Nocardioides carbamazepini]MCR1782249.1 hypothetical protein [Nocardioides carbamazepini]
MSGYGVLSPDDAARLLLPVAESVAAVHAASGRHGAISPAAVEVDESGRALLVDSSRVAPDPAYTAPGGADDVWSLAAVLLHATTGHPPGAYGTPPTVPRTTGWLAPLIELGLRPEARERPSAAELADYLRARVAPPAERRPLPVGALVLAGAAVLALLGVVGAALLFTGGDDAPRTRPESSDAASTEAEEEPTTAEPSADPTPPTAAELESFARDYVATASGDPDLGFTWLTAAYQQRSPRYQQVWASIRDPRLLSVTGDPRAMSVSYTYRYRLAGGGTRTEDITLFLVQDGDRLLIADATAH